MLVIRLIYRKLTVDAGNSKKLREMNGSCMQLATSFLLRLWLDAVEPTAKDGRKKNPSSYCNAVIGFKKYYEGLHILF